VGSKKMNIPSVPRAPNGSDHSLAHIPEAVTSTKIYLNTVITNKQKNLYKNICTVILIVSLKRLKSRYVTWNRWYSHPLLDMYNKCNKMYFCVLCVAGKNMHNYIRVREL
jgi:hypothetical protein